MPSVRPFLVAMTTNARTRRSCWLLRPALLLLCLPLQSCFTMGLWASDLDGHGKAGLTPVALALDVVTLPAQLAFFEGGGHHHHHHRRCR